MNGHRNSVEFILYTMLTRVVGVQHAIPYDREGAWESWIGRAYVNTIVL